MSAHRERDRAAYHLSIALRDPCKPDTCFPMFLACMDVLDRSIARFTPVANALNTFLTTPRTDSQIRQLQEKLTCRCSNASRGGPSQTETFEQLMHRKVFQTHPGLREVCGSPSDCLDELIASVLDGVGFAIATCLTGPGPPLRKPNKRQRFVKRTHRPCWPEHLYDLLPFGPENSVRALLRWISLPHSRPYTDVVVPLLVYLTGLDQLGRQAISAFVITSPSFWTKVIEFINVSILKWDDEMRCAGNSRFAATQVLNAFEKPVRNISDFITTIYPIIDSKQRHWFLKQTPELVGAVSKLPHWCEQLRGIASSRGIPQPDLDRAEGGLSNWATDMCIWHCNSDTERSSLFSSNLVAFSKQHSTLLEDPIGRAYQGLVDLLNHRRCAGPECGATFEGAERAFAVCSGCDRARYCSRECQRRAWRYPSAPHRKVCAKIRFVAERGAIERRVNESKDMRTFFESWQTVHTKDEDAWMINVLNDVSRNLTVLHTAKMFPSGMKTEANWLSDGERRVNIQG